MAKSNRDFFNGLEKKKAEESAKMCEHCQGVAACSQHGFKTIATEINGIVYTAVQMCEKEEARRRQNHNDHIFKNARIPAKYRNDQWRDYQLTDDNAEAVAAAKQTIDSKDGLLLYGSRGSGKTKLAALIAKAKLAKGQEVLFSSVPDLLDSIRHSYDNDGADSADMLDVIKHIHCLIIDDLGAERTTEWAGEQLFSILNYRNNEALQTIATSNYSPKQLIDKMSLNGDDNQGRRIVSRLLELCEPIPLNGKDYRLARYGR